MSRMPDAELDRLKVSISIVRLAEARGVVLKPHGSDLIGLCPRHDDHEPSLVITPSKNLWHCMGACEAGGTIIDWVMRDQGVSFRHALELLRADYDALNGTPPGQPVKLSSVRKLAPPVAPTADDQEALARVVAYYHEKYLAGTHR